jgi:adenylate cyclase
MVEVFFKGLPALTVNPDPVLTGKGATLVLSLLGPPSAYLDHVSGNRSALPSGTHVGLLAYLALRPDMLESRERLAVLFWGDVGEHQARQNLRQSLARLRRELGPAADEILSSDMHQVRLHRSHVRCDARELLDLCARGGLDDAQRTVDHYKGPFLDGLELRKDAFDAWRQSERHRIERVIAATLHRHAETQLVAGHDARTLGFAEKLVEIDPLNEEYQRLFLRVLLAFRGRQAALHHADALARDIRRELGCDPERETLALIADIRASTASAPAFERKPVTPPAGPSLAVLPFTDLGIDRQVAYIADGITEDITTELSRLRWLFVISRNSALVYQAGAVDTRQIDTRQVAAELGVRYILKGNVRVEDGRLRVNAHLIDAESSIQLWAEKFDRTLTDIFTVQDEITERVVAAIEPRLYSQEGFRVARRPVEDLDCWGLIVTAIGLVHRFERQPNETARDLLEKALARDPGSARAHAILGWALFWAHQCFWLPEGVNGFELACAHAKTATQLDQGDPWAHITSGFFLSHQREHSRGIAALETALQLNPSFALGRMLLGWAEIRAGNFERAVLETAKALRLSPMDNFASVYQATHGLALMSAGRFEEALPLLRASVTPHTEYMGHYNILISCCGHMGLIDEAQRLLAYRTGRLGRILRLHVVDVQLAGFAHREMFMEGLRLAGLENEMAA